MADPSRRPPLGSPPPLPPHPLVFHLPFLHHLLLRRQFGSVLAVLRTHQSATSARARVWRRPWKCTRRERPLSCTVPAWSAVYPRATTATTWRCLLRVLRAWRRSVCLRRRGRRGSARPCALCVRGSTCPAGIAAVCLGAARRHRSSWAVWPAPGYLRLPSLRIVFSSPPR